MEHLRPHQIQERMRENYVVDRLLVAEIGLNWNLEGFRVQRLRDKKFGYVAVLGIFLPRRCGRGHEERPEVFLLFTLLLGIYLRF